SIILTSVKTDSEVKISCSTSAKTVNKAKMNCIIDYRAQDLKMLRQLSNLDKYNLNIIQTVQKKLNKIAKFINMISAVENTVTNNHFFKLLSR
ncbi:hypothetical protein BDDG_13131, partial [Blastomyces dermatitidis ATCC 18188]